MADDKRHFRWFQRPLASPVARWQACNGERITNLRHETLTLKDVSALRLLALLDGTRTREALAKAWAEALAGDLSPATRAAGADLAACGARVF